MSAASPIRAGVIGFKNHAEKVIALIQQSGLAQVCRVYHPTKKCDGFPSTNQLEDLLDCDALFILSPNDTHYEYLRYCESKFQGYVYCEKPPVSTLSELAKIRDLDCKRFFFNFNLRFGSFPSFLAESIGDGSLGRPLHAVVHLTHGFAFKEAYLNSWRSQERRNGRGLLETVAIHFIDLFALCFGDISRLTYWPGNFSERGTASDTCSVGVQYANGCTASAFCSYASVSKFHLEVLGTNGRLVYEPNSLSLYSPRDTFEESGKFATPPLLRSQKLNGKDLFEESMPRSIEFFLNHCLGKKALPSSYFALSLKSTEAVLGVQPG